MCLAQPEPRVKQVIPESQHTFCLLHGEQAASCMTVREVPKWTSLMPSDSTTFLLLSPFASLSSLLEQFSLGLSNIEDGTGSTCSNLMGDFTTLSYTSLSSLL